MKNSELKQLWERAYQHANRRGHHSVADDFAQEACLAWIRGRKASPEQLLIDFLRKEYGSTGVRRSVKGLNRKIQRFDEISVETPLGDSGRTIGDNLAAPGGDPGSFQRTGEIGIRLGGKAALVCELVEQGYLLREVGEILGFTESRASQILKASKKEIMDEILIREKYDEYKDFKESSILVIDWIAI